MKKILVLALLIMLNSQFCFAQNQEVLPVNNSVNSVTEPTTTDDIDSYFDDTDNNQQPSAIIQQEQPQEDMQLNGSVEYNAGVNVESEKNAVNLDSTEIYKSVNLSKPKSVGSNSLVDKKEIFVPLQDSIQAASKFSSQEYDIRPQSSEYSRKYGSFKFGTSYNSSMSSAQRNYATEFFTRYDSKHFSLTGAFSKSTNSYYDSYDNNFSITPELKLSKRLSLLDVMQTDAEQIDKSNKIVLRYKPKFTGNADNLEFEVSAGQSYYQDTYVKSSVGFATRFKL